MTKSTIIRNAGIVAASGAMLAAGSVAPANAYAVAETAPAPAPVQYNPSLASYDASAEASINWNYEAPAANWGYEGSFSLGGTPVLESTASISAQSNGIAEISGSLDVAGGLGVSGSVSGGIGVSNARDAVISAAYDGIGGAYIWGGHSYKAWDCSGFVSYIYAQAGINLTAYTYTMATELTPTADPQPGDIVFTNGYAHVGIYIGNGQMISALNPTQGTVISSVDGGGLMSVDGYYSVGI